MNAKILKQEVLNITDTGMFYTKSSLMDILIKKLGKNTKISSNQLSTLLQRLKKSGLMKYNNETKFWTATNKSHQMAEKGKKKILNTRNKSDLKNVLDELEKITNKSNIFNHTLNSEYSSDVDLTEINLINRIDKIVSRMVYEKLKETTISNYEDLILKSVKEVIKDEFRLEIVPVLLTNIKNRIEQELDNRILSIKDDINNNNEKQLQKIRNVGIVFTKIGDYLKQIK